MASKLTTLGHIGPYIHPIINQLLYLELNVDASLSILSSCTWVISTILVTSIVFNWMISWLSFDWMEYSRCFKPFKNISLGFCQFCEYSERYLFGIWGWWIILICVVIIVLILWSWRILKVIDTMWTMWNCMVGILWRQHVRIYGSLAIFRVGVWLEIMIKGMCGNEGRHFIIFLQHFHITI